MLEREYRLGRSMLGGEGVHVGEGLGRSMLGGEGSMLEREYGDTCWEVKGWEFGTLVKRE